MDRTVDLGRELESLVQAAPANLDSLLKLFSQCEEIVYKSDMYLPMLQAQPHISTTNSSVANGDLG